MPSIQSDLIRWGKSRKLNDAYHLDYPHETPFSRLSKSDGWAVRLPPLDEDRHLMVDSVVSQLGMIDEYRHAVIILAYVEDCSDAVIARALTKETGERYSRHTVQEMRHRAEGWIESRLDY